MKKLTSEQATKLGWIIGHTQSGLRRVTDTDGQVYRETDHKRGADVKITFKMDGLPPMYLRKLKMKVVKVQGKVKLPRRKKIVTIDMGE